MERWVHTRAFASVLGPRGRASLDAPLHGAKSSLDDDVPTPRLGRGVEPVTGGAVSDDSHPPLRCEPTMTIQRTSTPYVSGYGESAVPTLSASERSSIDVSERTLHVHAQEVREGAKQMQCVANRNNPTRIVDVERCASNAFMTVSHQRYLQICTLRN